MTDDAGLAARELRKLDEYTHQASDEGGDEREGGSEAGLYLTHVERLLEASSGEPAGWEDWQKVLRDCEAGNLQAVLDEYVFQLRSQQAPGPVSLEQLWAVTETSSARSRSSRRRC